VPATCSLCRNATCLYCSSSVLQQLLTCCSGQTRVIPHVGKQVYCVCGSPMWLLCMLYAMRGKERHVSTACKNFSLKPLFSPLTLPTAVRNKCHALYTTCLHCAPRLSALPFYLSAFKWCCHLMVRCLVVLVPGTMFIVQWSGAVLAVRSAPASAYPHEVISVLFVNLCCGAVHPHVSRWCLSVAVLHCMCCLCRYFRLVSQLMLTPRAIHCRAASTIRHVPWLRPF
jgi:hypothetical protein